MSQLEDPPIVLNLLGGPASGKSTIAYGVAENLKWEHVNCDLVQEYVKQKVYEQSFRTLEHQIYVFSKQLHRLWVRAEEVDAIVCDASLLNSLIYHSGETSFLFKALVMQEYAKFDNINIFIERSENAYDESGRMQDEEEAVEIDRKIKRTMRHEGIGFEPLSGGRDRTQTVTDMVLSRLEERGKL